MTQKGRTPTIGPRRRVHRVIHNRWETIMEPSSHIAPHKTPWNKGKLIGKNYLLFVFGRKSEWG